MYTYQLNTDFDTCNENDINILYCIDISKISRQRRPPTLEITYTASNSHKSLEMVIRKTENRLLYQAIHSLERNTNDDDDDENNDQPYQSFYAACRAGLSVYRVYLAEKRGLSSNSSHQQKQVLHHDENDDGIFLNSNSQFLPLVFTSSTEISAQTRTTSQNSANQKIAKTTSTSSSSSSNHNHQLFPRNYVHDIINDNTYKEFPINNDPAVDEAVRSISIPPMEQISSNIDQVGLSNSNTYKQRRKTTAGAAIIALNSMLSTPTSSNRSRAAPPLILSQHNQNRLTTKPGSRTSLTSSETCRIRDGIEESTDNNENPKLDKNQIVNAKTHNFFDDDGDSYESYHYPQTHQPTQLTTPQTARQHPTNHYSAANLYIITPSTANTDHNRRNDTYQNNQQIQSLLDSSQMNERTPQRPQTTYKPNKRALEPYIIPPPNLNPTINDIYNQSSIFHLLGVDSMPPPLTNTQNLMGHETQISLDIHLSSNYHNQSKYNTLNNHNDDEWYDIKKINDIYHTRRYPQNTMPDSTSASSSESDDSEFDESCAEGGGESDSEYSIDQENNDIMVADNTKQQGPRQFNPVVIDNSQIYTINDNIVVISISTTDPVTSNTQTTFLNITPTDVLTPKKQNTNQHNPNTVTNSPLLHSKELLSTQHSASFKVGGEKLPISNSNIHNLTKSIIKCTNNVNFNINSSQDFMDDFDGDNEILRTPFPPLCKTNQSAILIYKEVDSIHVNTVTVPILPRSRLSVPGTAVCISLISSDDSDDTAHINDDIINLSSNNSQSGVQSQNLKLEIYNNSNSTGDSFIDTDAASGKDNHTNSTDNSSLHSPMNNTNNMITVEMESPLLHPFSVKSTTLPLENITSDAINLLSPPLVTVTENCDSMHIPNTEQKPVLEPNSCAESSLFSSESDVFDVQNDILQKKKAHEHISQDISQENVTSFNIRIDNSDLPVDSSNIDALFSQICLNDNEPSHDAITTHNENDCDDVENLFDSSSSDKNMKLLADRRAVYSVAGDDSVNLNDLNEHESGEINPINPVFPSFYNHLTYPYQMIAPIPTPSSQYNMLSYLEPIYSNSPSNMYLDFISCRTALLMGSALLADSVKIGNYSKCNVVAMVISCKNTVLSTKFNGEVYHSLSLRIRDESLLEYNEDIDVRIFYHYQHIFGAGNRPLDQVITPGDFIVLKNASINQSIRPRNSVNATGTIASGPKVHHFEMNDKQHVDVKDITLVLNTKSMSSFMVFKPFTIIQHVLTSLPLGAFMSVFGDNAGTKLVKDKVGNSDKVLHETSMLYSIQAIRQYLPEEEHEKLARVLTYPEVQSPQQLNTPNFKNFDFLYQLPRSIIPGLLLLNLSALQRAHGLMLLMNTSHMQKNNELLKYLPSCKCYTADTLTDINGYNREIGLNYSRYYTVNKAIQMKNANVINNTNQHNSGKWVFNAAYQTAHPRHYGPENKQCSGVKNTNDDIYQFHQSCKCQCLPNLFHKITQSSYFGELEMSDTCPIVVDTTKNTTFVNEDDFTDYHCLLKYHLLPQLNNKTNEKYATCSCQLPNTIGILTNTTIFTCDKLLQYIYKAHHPVNEGTTSTTAILPPQSRNNSPARSTRRNRRKSNKKQLDKEQTETTPPVQDSSVFSLSHPYIAHLYLLHNLRMIVTDLLMYPPASLVPQTKDNSECAYLPSILLSPVDSPLKVFSTLTAHGGVDSLPIITDLKEIIKVTNPGKVLVLKKSSINRLVELILWFLPIFVDCPNHTQQRKYSVGEFCANKNHGTNVNLYPSNLDKNDKMNEEDINNFKVLDHENDDNSKLLSRNEGFLAKWHLLLTSCYQQAVDPFLARNSRLDSKNQSDTSKISTIISSTPSSTITPAQTTATPVKSIYSRKATQTPVKSLMDQPGMSVSNQGGVEIFDLPLYLSYTPSFLFSIHWLSTLCKYNNINATTPNEIPQNTPGEKLNNFNIFCINPNVLYHLTTLHHYRQPSVASLLQHYSIMASVNPSGGVSGEILSPLSPINPFTTTIHTPLNHENMPSSFVIPLPVSFVKKPTMPLEIASSKTGINKKTNLLSQKPNPTLISRKQLAYRAAAQQDLHYTHISNIIYGPTSGYGPPSASALNRQSKIYNVINNPSIHRPAVEVTPYIDETSFELMNEIYSMEANDIGSILNPKESLQSAQNSSISARSTSAHQLGHKVNKDLPNPRTLDKQYIHPDNDTGHHCDDFDNDSDSFSSYFPALAMNKKSNTAQPTKKRKGVSERDAKSSIGGAYHVNISDEESHSVKYVKKNNGGRFVDNKSIAFPKLSQSINHSSLSNNGSKLVQLDHNTSKVSMNTSKSHAFASIDSLNFDDDHFDTF